jgi:hypothetical protein
MRGRGCGGLEWRGKKRKSVIERFISQEAAQERNGRVCVCVCVCVCVAPQTGVCTRGLLTHVVTGMVCVRAWVSQAHPGPAGATAATAAMAGAEAPPPPGAIAIPGVSHGPQPLSIPCVMNPPYGSPSMADPNLNMQLALQQRGAMPPAMLQARALPPPSMV